MSSAAFVALVLFGSMIILFLLKVPIGFSLLLSSIIALVVCTDTPLQIIPQRLFNSTDSFPFMAVPFFVLSGAIMSHGGISQRLIAFCDSLIGHLPGGLGLVSVLACMFFAAISGSGAATTAAIGGIMIPQMVERNYDKNFASAINASGGTIGVIIPPSIPFVTYGVISGASIGALFVAGVIPGILMGLSMMAVILITSKKRGFKSEKRATGAEIWNSFKEAILAILLPVIILGGIYSGIFSATEAAVVSVVYAFIVSKFIYRSINWKELVEVFKEAAVSSASILLLIASAGVFGWILSNNNIPSMIANAMLSLSSNKIVILLLINLLLFIIGTFLDTVAALIILVPILLPIATTLGVDPVHLGMIMCVNLAIGQITPPFGCCLFVACGVASIKLEDIIKAIWPFILGLIVVVLVITFIPQLSLFLPGLRAGL